MDELIKRYRTSINPPYNWKDYLNLTLTLLLLIGLPAILFLAQQRQDIRQRAEESDQVSLGPLRLEPTFQSISIELPFSGDDNGNATASAEYKRSSDTEWTAGPSLLRSPRAEGPHQGQVAGIIKKAFAQSPLPVFPGAIGFGTDIHPARGSTVYKVTTLAETGPGSLKDCVSQPNRVCIFEVSGVIHLTTPIIVKQPYITIAGQTAPAPGITLYGRLFKISSHDVLVQHIRQRVGCCNGSMDGFGIEGGAYNIVVDHASVSWSTDENISAHGVAPPRTNTQNITYSNTISSEGLMPHSKGGVAKFPDKVSYINNLFAHNEARNPKFGDSVNVSNSQFHSINNLIYNWGNEEIKIDGDGTAFKKVNLVGNVFKAGVDSRLNEAIIVELLNGNQIFADDNKRIDTSGNEVIQRAGDCGPSNYIFFFRGGDCSGLFTSPPFPIGFTPRSSSQVYEHVLTNVGARPAERGTANGDPIDERIIRDVRNGTGRLINQESEVGGIPTIAQNTHTLTPPGNQDGDENGDGYTNLENWLQTYAATVEGGGGGPLPTPGPTTSPGPTASPTATPIPTPTPIVYNGRFTGQIEGLSPNTSYDIRVTLSDPDGVVGNPVVLGTTTTLSAPLPTPTPTPIPTSTPRSSPTPTPTVRPSPTPSGTSTIKSLPTPTPTPISGIGTSTLAPLTFSNISAGNISNTSATIRWTTSREGTSRVVYGKSAAVLASSTAEDARLVTSHSVGLQGLAANTTYYYRVFSKDAGGRQYSSLMNTFTTTNTTISIPIFTGLLNFLQQAFR